MNALDIFRYDNTEVRVVMIDGEPWFVLTDICSVLGIANVGNVGTRVDQLSIRHADVQNARGQIRQTLVVDEAGMYEVVIRSDKPEAAAFRRWITSEVLPAIRTTGSYSTAPALPQSYADALRELAATVERSAELEAANAELTPRAEAWDELASADGDYAVADAAKILARAGVQTGPQRLFEQLAGMRWIHRAHDGKWRAYASKVDLGYLTEKPQSHYHPRTSELVLDAPQVRVTVRGLERLRVRLGSIETGAAA